jgi:hypothetical protein
MAVELSVPGDGNSAPGMGLPQGSESTLGAAAERIRGNSIEGRSLTLASSVVDITGDSLKPMSLATTFAITPGFEDIKSTIGPQNQLYFYSDRSLTGDDARSLLYAEEVLALIAQKVRDDSEARTVLTPLSALAVIPGAEPEKVDAHIGPLLHDNRYSDVRFVTNSKGTRYLYSANSMTETYAMVLARADADDPIGTIATTVREDSSLYPRPTPLATFLAPIFKMDSNRLEDYAAALVSEPSYSDIKLVRASNGAPYLFSDRYLGAAWVRATVEWEEVGKYDNP